MKKDPVEFLKHMLEIYSPSGKEEKLSSFLAEELRTLGFEEVWKDEAGNVYGAVGKGSPIVLMCGHMDTVPGEIPVKVKNGRVYGRGAVDAKSSLAAMILAAANLKNRLSKIGGRIIVAGVVDEEGEGRGIKQLIREGLKVDYAFFGEPSGIGNITFAYKGHMLLKIEFKTVSGHVGAQHLLSNAIEEAMKFWGELKNLCEQKYKSPFGIFYSLTPSIIEIKSLRTMGGTPDLCTIGVDLRLPPKIKCEKAVKIVGEIVESFRKENPKITVKFRVISQVEPYVANRGNPVIRALREAIFEETGREARLIRKTGTGDMNIFGSFFNVPVATYGPGNSILSHSPNEYVEISEYLKSIEIYKKAVEKVISGSLGAKISR